MSKFCFNVENIPRPVGLLFVILTKKRPNMRSPRLCSNNYPKARRLPRLLTSRLSSSRFRLISQRSSLWGNYCVRNCAVFTALVFMSYSVHTLHGSSDGSDGRRNRSRPEQQDRQANGHTQDAAASVGVIGLSGRSLGGGHEDIPTRSDADSSDVEDKNLQLLCSANF